jgi:hypothetical protein
VQGLFWSLDETAGRNGNRNLGREQGDSYDHALAETVNGLYKTELLYRRGLWRGREDLELATLEWVDWFNHRHLFSAIGYLLPAEYEAETSALLVTAAVGTQEKHSPLNPGRFTSILGRPLTTTEAREAVNIVRRLTALVLLESQLDGNYRRVREPPASWNPE